MRRFDPRGPVRLGWNQIAVGLLIVLYAAWSIWDALHGDALKELRSMSKELASLGIDVDGIAQQVSTLALGALAMFGIVVPGATAWYYFSRAKLVKKMRHQTPPWVIEMINVAG